MAAEVEDTLKRLSQQRGVLGCIVMNNDGVPIKSTMDNAATINYTGLISGQGVIILIINSNGEYCSKIRIQVGGAGKEFFQGSGPRRDVQLFEAEDQEA